LAGRLLERAQALLLVRGGEVEEIASVLGDGRQPGPRLSFGLVDVGEADQPAEVGVAAEVAGDQEHLGSIDLEGGADQGLDPNLAAGLQEFDRSINATAVGDRERGHLQLCGAHRQLGGMRSPVEEREVGVAVELDVRRHLCRRLLATTSWQYL